MDRTPPDAAASPIATPWAEPHPDPADLLRRCEQAAIEREGVAMFVGIHDARITRACPEGTAAPAPAEARRLRELYDRYVAALRPGRDQRRPSPDPTGGAWSLVEVLVVMSEQHLRAPVEQVRS